MLSLLFIQPSHLCRTTGKTIALTIQTFVSKVMSPLFNAQSRFIIAILPWSIFYFHGCNHCPQWFWSIYEKKKILECLVNIWPVPRDDTPSPQKTWWWSRRFWYYDLSLPKYMRHPIWLEITSSPKLIIWGVIITGKVRRKFSQKRTCSEESVSKS